MGEEDVEMVVDDEDEGGEKEEEEKEKGRKCQIKSLNLPIFHSGKKRQKKL